MANLGQIYDAEQMPESTDFTPLPDGWYQAKVVSSEVKPTKAALEAMEAGARDTSAKDDKYLNLQYEILGPTYQGRMVFGMINLDNKNDTAQRIGRAALTQLIFSAGLRNVSDDDQLIGAVCEIKLGLDKAKDGYEAKNVIKAFRAIEGSKRPAVTGPGKPFGKPATPAKAPAQATAPKGKTWMSK